MAIRPSDAELRALHRFVEPLRPVRGTSSDQETEALASALREETHDDRGIDGLRGFVDAFPASRWRPAIELNLGSISYATGYFGDALVHWGLAWELGKLGEDSVAIALANQALAELAQMNARIGRFTELEALLAAAQARTLLGDARVKIESAAEGLWSMRNRPGTSFRCGPYALLNVAHELTPMVDKKTTSFLEKVQSPPTGFSLSDVHRMSSDLGVPLQMAKRLPGAAIIVPAVVHWKVGHFGALVREVGGRFLLKDPTFGNETWLGMDALDQEASGYFLVPTGELPSGWSRPSAAEAEQVRGKGAIWNIDPDSTGDSDAPAGGGGCLGAPLAMATYQFHVLAASLHIEDTPLGYAAATGPDVRVRVAYNQREASQPSTMDFTNFGPQFVSNWISYLTDNPSSPATNISVRKRGGGGEVHTSFNTASQSYGLEPKTGAVLYRLTPNTYKKVYPDGRAEFYEQYLGTTGAQRRVLLSRVVDAEGREVTIEYDAAYPSRIHEIVDATGLPTVFRYDYPGSSYLVTSIEDPFGREATFAYTSVAGAVRLQSIQDPYGIVSSFTYSAAGEINAMTTPYGTTTFGLSPPTIGTGGHALIRFVEATDPLGQTERVEYNLGYPVGTSSTLEQPQPSSSIVNFSTATYDRNSFYFDKLQMKLAPGNYAKAHLYHWLQPTAASSVTSILENELPPLEGRVFYNYPGQTQPYIQGTLASPSVVARVVKDAQGNNQTQATKYEYNAQGNVTRKTDPIGRQTATEYAANGVDVTAIKQKTGASTWATMSTFVYAPGTPPHRPSSVTDGAGQTTLYTYTPTGQVATIQNAKGESTTFTYETNTSSASYDRVLSITGDVAGGNRSFSYDDYGRVLTTTDSEGYALTYAYDSLDRVRTTTYPDGSLEQLEYEDHSLVASRDRAGRWTRHMYNPLMQRVVTQDPELRMTQSQWCRCGKLRRFADSNGNITEWVRDESSRVTKKVQADGSFNSYTYDFSGRLLSEVDPMGRSTAYQYTIDDRISKKDYSDTATADVTYAYDPYFPRIASRVDGVGTTTFGYHPYGTGTLGAGQVALENGPFTNDTQKHTYDQLGRLKKLEIVDDATGAVASYSEEYTFDARARVTGVQNNLGLSTYGFVGQTSRPSTVSYPNGMQILYDYFGLTGDFLLKQIKNLSAGPTPTVISQFDYTYGPDRSIDTWTVDQGSGASTWSFGYDGARQLTSAKRSNATTTLESLYYGYDKAGNRTQVGSGSGAPRNYDVNNLNQLLSERDHGRTTFAGFVDEPATVKVNGRPAKVMSTDGGAPFRFEGMVDLDAGANTVVVEAKDGRNNVATKTYAVTTTGTSKTFEYDADGNLRYQRLPGGSVEREYRWDQQNRLIRAVTGSHESVYEYDGESRRVRIKELTSGAETKNETFVWCGSRICQKRTGTMVVRNYFEQGFEEGTTDYFYTRDQLGSVREVVGSDGTTAASRLSYDPWGRSTETGSGALSDFAFTGHHLDRPTGLTLSWYRGYDPSLGRWLTKDPIGIRGGFHQYAYVNNSPENAVDLDGKLPVPWTPLPPFHELHKYVCTLSCEDHHDKAIDACRAGTPSTEPPGDTFYCPNPPDWSKFKPVCEMAADYYYEFCIEMCDDQQPEPYLPSWEHPQIAGN